MNITIDILLALLGVSIIIWYTCRGFFKTLLSLVRLVAATLIAYLLTPLFGDNAILRGIGCFLVFAAAYVLLTFVVRLMDKILKKTPLLKTANRILGLVFGCFCAYIILSAATVALSVFDFSSGSLIYGFFEQYGVFSIVC